MFSKKDQVQLTGNNKHRDRIQQQLDLFIKAKEQITLTDPAILGSGIINLTQAQQSDYIEYYSHHINKITPGVFIPASGAATRMFQSLIFFLNNEPDITEQNVKKWISTGKYNRSDLDQLKNFMDGLRSDKFAFCRELDQIFVNCGASIASLAEANKYAKILEILLTDKGLNYAGLPKALLNFHQYPDNTRTPFEEHLVEASGYAKINKNEVNIHFTVSPEFRLKSDKFLKKLRRAYANKNLNFKIGLSVQDESTNTIAVDKNNNPLRDEKNNLIFRPGGHGALLTNLNHLNYDIIFIKNIDNIVPDRLKTLTIRYKKVIGGYLLSLLETIYQYQKIISNNTPTTVQIKKMVEFGRKKLNIILPDNFYDLGTDQQAAMLKSIFFRPVRVCAMVKNTGEPGGGPFWIKRSGMGPSLQIVEKSQVNMDKSDQKNIFNSSTHFNPVDIVCSIKDYSGKKYDLNKFVDRNTYFIAEKSMNGMIVKALELPGLWNGSMAYWTTVFMQVPLETFNPVKTVNDLLKPEHQV